MLMFKLRRRGPISFIAILWIATCRLLQSIISCAETIMVQIVTIHTPNCHDRTICFPCRLKQTRKQGTNDQQPTKIHLSARPLGKGNTALKRQRGEGNACSMHWLCALRLYNQLMSDRVVTTQYSKAREWPLNIQRRVYLWKKNAISNLIFWVLTQHRHLPGFSRCISPV